MRRSKAVPCKLRSVRSVLINISKAAEITNHGKDWFYDNMNAGTLPFRWFMLGERCMDSADIDDWIKQNEIPPGKRLGYT